MLDHRQALKLGTAGQILPALGRIREIEHVEIARLPFHRILMGAAVIAAVHVQVVAGHGAAEAGRALG